MNVAHRQIGIVSLPDRERATPVLTSILQWLSQRDCVIHMDEDTASLLDPELNRRFPAVALDRLPAFAEMILVLGGDGTLLRVARYIGKEGIPILGVNLGKLGFLTDVKEDEVIPKLEAVINGRYSLDERMVLHAEVQQMDGTVRRAIFALNDIVINNGPQSKLISLATSVDGKWINTFLSDGLIIASPTGSTAYSLSAGGPILHPRLHAILITPICPHILTNRPIVISDKEKITVEVQEKGMGNRGVCFLSADGLVIARLKPGDSVEVGKASHTIKLIQPEGTDYYHVLRTKLKWGERG